MSYVLLSDLSPLSFLQMFVTQSVKLAGQQQEDATCHNHIQVLGLTASSCLEAHARQQLGLSGEISVISTRHLSSTSRTRSAVALSGQRTRQEPFG